MIQATAPTSDPVKTLVPMTVPRRRAMTHRGQLTTIIGVAAWEGAVPVMLRTPTTVIRHLGQLMTTTAAAEPVMLTTPTTVIPHLGQRMTTTAVAEPVMLTTPRAAILHLGQRMMTTAAAATS